MNEWDRTGYPNRKFIIAVGFFLDSATSCVENFN